MDDFSEPGYTVDFTDELTRKRIRSAKCSDTFKVKVRLIGQLGSPAHEGTGTRSGDGQDFNVSVSTEKGIQTFSWSYENAVLLADARGKP